VHIIEYFLNKILNVFYYCDVIRYKFISKQLKKINIILIIMPTKKTKSKATKTTKTTKTTKSTTPVETPAVAPVAAAPVAPVAAAAVKEVETPTLQDAFQDLLGQLASLRTQLTSVTTQARALSKRSDRELRAAQKLGRKRPRKTGNRAPSGFVKPTLISKELALFLSKPDGTEMARTEVTREINGYIRANSLQDPKNGRRILPDKKLAKLLRIKKDDELTYFNLQRYMSPHFAKSGSKEVAANSA
jgi:chromatin remodeling complex protein RSC6